MDLALARTFIAIVEAGSFVNASHRLHVTQSTVSMRVRSLEQLLGKSLFTRNNAACELTPAGRRFYRYARSLLRIWEEGRHELAVPETFSDSLGIAGQYSLWDGFLLEWLPRFRAAEPSTALRLSAGMPHRLMAELLEGVHDLIVIHSPELRPGVVVEELFEDRLRLFTTDPGGEFRSRYLFLDWGDAFRTMHAEALPDLHTPGLSLAMGPLGVDLMIRSAGAGYVPERIALPLVQRSLLHSVPDAPAFLYPAHAVCPQESTTRRPVQEAIRMLREAARSLVNRDEQMSAAPGRERRCPPADDG